MGVREAPLPGDGQGHSVGALHRVGHRGHERRRLRQRHAALAAHPAHRGLRPPAHLHRSRPRSARILRGEGEAVPPARFLVGGLRRERDEHRRHHRAARLQGGRALTRGARGPGHFAGSRKGERRGAGPARAPGRRRAALERGNRHLREGLGRDPRRCRRPLQHPGAGGCERTARQGRGRGRQSRAHAEGAHRVRAGRRAPERGRARQFGGRFPVGPRGQPQDPAQRGGGGRAHDGSGAQPHAARPGGTRLRPGAARQRLSEPGGVARCHARPRGSRRLSPAHLGAGEGRLLRPLPRASAHLGAAARARRDRIAPDPAGAVRAARARQAPPDAPPAQGDAHRRPGRERLPGALLPAGPPSTPPANPVLPPTAWGARSWPASSPTTLWT